MPRALKTYRTAIGFHDAYVAAPSQKAALKAWGADGNLFAQGLAELVTDPALTAEPLAHPGEVIKRTRGKLADHIAALPQSAPRKKPKSRQEPPPAPKAKPRRKARPDRKPLDQAERALAHAERAQEAERRALVEREAELRRERQAMTGRHEAELQRLEREKARARAAYDRALETWQDDRD